MNEKLANFLYDQTLKLRELPEEAFSAPEIAKAVKLNRTTISSYLNQGVRSGELIKIKSYPVKFLHQQALYDLGIPVKQSEYETFEELLHSEEKPSALESVIGASGSLKEALDQIKTAVLYPHNGLPILLIGASGSGKTFLAEKIYQYTIEQKVIAADAPFISYNCAQYFNNPELLSSTLFGYTKGAFTGAEQAQSGLIEKADGGVLFLDEVHRLSEEGQEKLFTFMDTGEFSPMGDSSQRKKAKVRLVFATTENIYSAFLPTFLRRLPVIINLPNFQNRPQAERLHLIDSFFLNESEILSKELHVSYQMIDFLLRSDLEGNVGKIKNMIKYACGSAFVRQKQLPIVKVRLGDLPVEYALKLKELTNFPKKQLPDRKYLPHTDQQIHLESKASIKLQQFFTELLENFAKVEQKALTSQDFIQQMVQKVTALMDEFIFQESYEKEESFYSVLTYHLRETLNFMHDSYGFEQEGNRLVALASYLYSKEQHHFLVSSSLQEQKRKLSEFLSSVMETPYWYAKKLLTHLAHQLDQDVYEEDIYFISFYFYSLNIANNPSEIKSIVLAHGYSTASSLANVVNRMLRKNIFQAYDMPIDITVEEVAEQVIRYISDYRTDAGLILLVDMGSFNQLGKKLARHIHGPLLIVDYVSTPLVLEIGEFILNKKSITEIHQQLDVQDRMQKQFILPEVKKKKAIVTCCYTGIGSATQIQEVLQKCLGEMEQELTIIPYDYHKLAANKYYETPFQLYDVLMIVGTEDPQINQIPFISLDQLLNGEAVERFVNILQQYFPIEDQQVKDDLIFSFSINKIVENLTILDANKLLRFIQKALIEVEKHLNITFTNNQQFLLYLHCACMIERLLRKEKVDEFVDMDDYMQHESSRIQLIHMAFSEIEKEYAITLTDEELRLLNDIIKG